jgi:hypothetical protein
MGIWETDGAACEFGNDSGTGEIEVADELNAGTGGRGRTGVAGTWAPLAADVLSAGSIWFASC